MNVDLYSNSVPKDKAGFTVHSHSVLKFVTSVQILCLNGYHVFDAQKSFNWTKYNYVSMSKLYLLALTSLFPVNSDNQGRRKRKPLEYIVTYVLRFPKASVKYSPVSLFINREVCLKREIGWAKERWSNTYINLRKWTILTLQLFTTSFRKRALKTFWIHWLSQVSYLTSQCMV